MLELIDSKVTGTQIAYNIVCSRKLWLFTHQIEMEKFSEYVEIGKIISEQYYKREKKEILIGDTIKVDFLKIGDEVIVNEIKKSKKLEDAHIWQVKFYIYTLQKLGINSKKGIIRYPKLMRKVEIEFTEEDRKIIENMLSEIIKIKNYEKPPAVINKKYCKKCAYYEFCYV